MMHAAAMHMMHKRTGIPIPSPRPNSHSSEQEVPLSSCDVAVVDASTAAVAALDAVTAASPDFDIVGACCVPHNLWNEGACAF